MAADYFCSLCRTPFANGFPLDDQGVCAACRSGLRGFDSAVTFGFYEGRLRELIHLLKYREMLPLAKTLGGWLTTAVPVDERFDAVIPVPLHWRKHWRRGFNQAEVLAREVAARRSVPLFKALKRVRASQPQAGLSKTARKRNAGGAFLADAALVKGKRILLVDDVMTTGATATACASELKRAGAGSVMLAALARADRRWGA